MTGEILFLAHRMPFPPNRGDKIRSHHILKALARLAPVHVGTFAEDAADLAEEGVLAEVAASYCLARRQKPLVIAGVEALARGKPVSLTAFATRKLGDYVAQVLADRPITAIYVFSGQMGQYVPANYGGRLIADFVDVDSAKFEAYGQDGFSPRRWIDRREAEMLRGEEARLARRAQVSLLISKPEAELFGSRLSASDQAACTVRVLGNGIDTAFFDRRAVAMEPQLQAMPGPRLIFTGQMDYAPNVAACLRMAERLMPAVRRSFPDASFHVVGRSPVPEVAAIAELPGCHVWGAVPDVRPWLAAADLAVVPLEIARGVQNKVLEAMAMELPVVLTSGAATGIDAVPDRDFCVADDDAALGEAIAGLCRDPGRAAEMGRSARRFVVERQSWSAALAPLGELINPECPPGACHAA